MVHTIVFKGWPWPWFSRSYDFVFVGDILVGKKGLILNMIFLVFIKSTVLRYFLMWICCPSPFNANLEVSIWLLYSNAKFNENDPKITLTQISAKCILVIPDINDLEDNGQGHMESLSKRMN